MYFQISLNECWITVAGIKIRYLESGKGKDKHVLFIHGLGSAADRWLNIPDKLSNFHCVAIDLPGFGESDKLRDINYTIAHFGKIIICF